MLEVFKALADPSRLRLVAVLFAGEFTVQELTSVLNMGQSRISRHLKILTEAGILSVKHQGTWSYYRAEGESPFFFLIRGAVKRGIEKLPERAADLAAVAAVLEERRRKSKAFFDRHAQQWDDLARTLLSLPEYRDLLLSLVPECRTIVEVGLGTGGLLSDLTAKAEKVVGVDHSQAMLEEARRRLAQTGIAGIDLRLGEMTHLPMPDSSADCAVVNMVLHHAADPQAVLRELRRVLVPGGVLVLADLSRHDREWVRERLADQWLGFERAELEEWLAAAGFADVKCGRVTGTLQQEVVLVLRAA
jgi:ubiquinone/menaquinone biosynthesis C-methylase UbiE